MTRHISLVVLSVAMLAVSPLATADPLAFGNSQWTLVQWWSGDPRNVPAGVSGPKEAFGKDAVNDRQVANTADMPGVGKVSGTLTRKPGFQVVKLGGVFTRDFSLTERADLTASAALEGFFAASGTFFSGGNTDMINAVASLVVKDKNNDTLFGSGSAFSARAATAQNPTLFQDIFPASDSKSNHMILPKGDYKAVFDFSSDMLLNGGNANDQLQTLFFSTFTANLSAAPVPEPSAGVLLGLGLIGLFARHRRERNG